MQSSHSMKTMFEQQPGMAFYKSLDHVYCVSSHYTAKLCGYKNAQEFSGRNDDELARSSYYDNVSSLLISGITQLFAGNTQPKETQNTRLPFCWKTSATD